MAEQMIFKAISDVMKDVGVIGKDKTNTQQGWKFRGIDDVMNALNPAMTKNNVFCAPSVLEMTREDRVGSKGNKLIYTILKIKYTFYTVDGSYVDCVVIGEAMDSGDKSCNKAMAIGMKYACFQIFCIPTEEMIDPDQESHALETIQQEQARKNKENPRTKNTEKPAEEKSDEQKNAEMVVKATADPDVLMVEQGGSPVDKKRARVKAELERTGVKPATVLGAYKVNSVDEMNDAQLVSAISRLKKSKDKA